jgi:hypothetical protein
MDLKPDTHNAGAYLATFEKHELTAIQAAYREQLCIESYTLLENGEDLSSLGASDISFCTLNGAAVLRSAGITNVAETLENFVKRTQKNVHDQLRGTREQYYYQNTSVPERLELCQTARRLAEELCRNQFELIVGATETDELSGGSTIEPTEAIVIHKQQKA